MYILVNEYVNLLRVSSFVPKSKFVSVASCNLFYAVILFSYKYIFLIRLTRV